MENLYDLLSDVVKGKKVVYQNNRYKIQEFCDNGYLKLKRGEIFLNVPPEKFKNIELIVKKPKSTSKDKIIRITEKEMSEYKRNIEEEYEKIQEATRFPLI
ncbi:hypothetical protein KAJ87_04565 [Candidatus Pacearchaeota archaeon]|nr:hypothetical protein [Candidatus Pacearchaeota archaeon]